LATAGDNASYRARKKRRRRRRRRRSVVNIVGEHPAERRDVTNAKQVGEKQ
jgi:hypothetical protein